MATVEVVGDATRGDRWALVRLTVEGDRIVAADADQLEAPLEGLTLLDAARVGGEPLAVEALAAALGQVFVAEPAEGRVAVAMSGGVDSAVALLRSAPNAIGVTLRLWQDPNGPSSEQACCSPASVAGARETCHSLGLPHVTLDLREEFRDAVVSHFVASYEAGDTPNPCTRCNGAFRFDALLEFAARAGAERLVTGHYARLVERRGKRLIGRAADPHKDQSYMLATVDPDILDRIEFPLGSQSKAETRTQAESARLAVAGRRESQEACFLAGGDYREFLERHELPNRPGDVVDEAGRFLGRHDGYWRFTPGQRRGLRIASGHRLHVLSTDRASNIVVVGPPEALESTRVEVEGRLYVPVDRAEVKLRYRSPAVPARVETTSAGFVLALDAPAQAVARGQTAVLYDVEAVVGAGVITGVA